jgi:hypothetical protein
MSVLNLFPNELKMLAQIPNILLLHKGDSLAFRSVDVHSARLP